MKVPFFGNVAGELPYPYIFDESDDALDGTHLCLESYRLSRK